MISISDRITLSIVSHGQGELIADLLGDLREVLVVLPLEFEILLTLNVAEDESFIAKFSSLPLKIIRNDRPRGFGANHNQAFALSSGDFFVVVNPDIRLRSFNFFSMLAILSSSKVGAYAPLVLSCLNTVEDSARRFPTFSILFGRVFLGRLESDYQFDTEPKVVDWVAGMFIAFQRKVFSEIGGFDERYYMYMEDADICRRLQKRGLNIVVDPTVSVIHNAQRASRRKLRHLSWHLRSALRFFLGV